MHTGEGAWKGCEGKASFPQALQCDWDPMKSGDALQPATDYGEEQSQRTGVPEKRFVFWGGEALTVLCTASAEHAPRGPRKCIICGVGVTKW